MMKFKAIVYNYKALLVYFWAFFLRKIMLVQNPMKYSAEIKL